MIDDDDMRSDPYSFHEGLALHKDTTTDKYGYINKKGKFVIQPKFDYGQSFVDGIASVTLTKNLFEKSIFNVSRDSCGYINKQGEFIIPPQYHSAHSFSEGYATVYLNRIGPGVDGTIGFSHNCLIINNQGHIIKEPQGMIFIGPFKNGYATKSNSLMRILYGGGTTFIDYELKDKTKILFEEAGNFSDGYAAIKLNGKWGFIRKDFNALLDINFDDVKPFNEGLAPVKRGRKWGYLNKDNIIEISFKYDECTIFRNGLAYVWINDNNFNIEGYINKSGQIIWHKKSIDK